jgi:hypothetical protein
MAEELDSVARYGKALGFEVRLRTVLVEGTSDVDIFHMAARLERAATGIDLLGEDLAIVAAGERDRGGASGVVRELVSLRGMSRTCLAQNGRPRYRFVGLFDNDYAGKQAVKLARIVDNSILEYKDVFRLWPQMPLPGNLDPGAIKRAFEKENAAYGSLDWELEDLLPDVFIDAFVAENSKAIVKTKLVGNKVHRDLTADGKAKLHYFVKQNAVRDDFASVIEVLKALRFYLGIR